MIEKCKDHEYLLEVIFDSFQQETLSAKEIELLKTCNAQFEVSGAGPFKVQKLEGNLEGFVLEDPPYYAPKAKDTKEVVRMVVSIVDGISKCTTDGSWIHK